MRYEITAELPEQPRGADVVLTGLGVVKNYGPPLVVDEETHTTWRAASAIVPRQLGPSLTEVTFREGITVREVRDEPTQAARARVSDNQQKGRDA